MDYQFQWHEEYNIGVPMIDKEHQLLFKIINRIFSLRETEKNSQWACREGIKFFKNHAVQHFEDEEAYMASIDYPGLEHHRRIHQNFRETTLPALEEELEQTQYAPEAIDHFLGVCAGWLIGHTMTEDLAIVDKGVQSWQHMLPGEDVETMEQVILQLLFDLFHLESQLISVAYQGEKFGRGLYYQLVYHNEQQGETQEVLIAFEEKLLLNTVGKLIGIQTNRLNTLLIHAARYTARQFVARLIDYFPTLTGCQLKEETLLSYEQFRKICQREKLQLSLLFNTGSTGYFACCMLAPHLLENGVGHAIQPENALAEVENYLNQQMQQSSRKKILVVDDSATIRQSMAKLLSQDYQVSLAESGVAAIRAISLDRPDLVLLDYEMPIYNGKQTMKMMRSEPDFADIPVIFLTGRSDSELVRSLLSLRPEGYLLKYLKPQEIKRKIDGFFRTSSPITGIGGTVKARHSHRAKGGGAASLSHDSLSFDLEDQSLPLDFDLWHRS